MRSAHGASHSDASRCSALSATRVPKGPNSRIPANRNGSTPVKATSARGSDRPTRHRSKGEKADATRATAICGEQSTARRSHDATHSATYETMRNITGREPAATTTMRTPNCPPSPRPRPKGGNAADTIAATPANPEPPATKHGPRITPKSNTASQTATRLQPTVAPNWPSRRTADCRLHGCTRCTVIPVSSTRTLIRLCRRPCLPCQNSTSSGRSR